MVMNGPQRTKEHQLEPTTEMLATSPSTATESVVTMPVFNDGEGPGGWHYLGPTMAPIPEETDDFASPTSPASAAAMTPGTSFIAPAQNPLKKSAMSTDSKPKKRLMNGIGGFLARMRADSSGSVESHQNHVEKENIDDRVSTNCNSPRTTNNVTQRLREVHTTEQIDTLISTLPKEEIPEELNNFPPDEIVVDPRMAHVHVTENLPGVHPSARGSHYCYTYESHLDDVPDNAKNDTLPGTTFSAQPGSLPFHHMNGTTADELRVDEWEEKDEDIQHHEALESSERLDTEGDKELHSTSTKKVTKVTKITTTRSIRQVPVDPDDLYFDSDGMVAPADETLLMDSRGRFLDAGYNFVNDDDYGIDLKRMYVRDDHAVGSAPSHTPSLSSVPSSPGVPEVTEIGEDFVSLAWLRPDRDGIGGELIGYRVEFRRSEFDEWDPAHEDLLAESECKITNLDPSDVYEFRVRAANASGLGPPSKPSRTIHLSELGAMPSSISFGHYTEEGAPVIPNKPKVVSIDDNKSSVLLDWDPSTSAMSQLDVQNYRYNVEYRVVGTDEHGSWIQSNHQPIGPGEFRYLVENLRPYGDYEFRLIAIDSVGRRSAPSQPSEVVRIQSFMLLPSRRRKFQTNPALETPGIPQALESGPTWVHVRWEPASPTPKQIPSPSTAKTSTSTSSPAPLGYLLELRHIDENSKAVPTTDEKIPWLPLITAQAFEPDEDSEEGSAEGQASSWDNCKERHGPRSDHENFAGDEKDKGLRETDPSKLTANKGDYQITTTSSDFIVENLRSEATYQFRVSTVSLLDGSYSVPSDPSKPIRIAPSSSSSAASNDLFALERRLRRPPHTPNAPEYLDDENLHANTSQDANSTLTLCWLPARSILPVQGYEVEFRDRMQDPINWYKITDQLVRACRTTIGYLIPGHQYQFRVVARNAAGASPPSDPSPLVTIQEDPMVAKSVKGQEAKAVADSFKALKSTVPLLPPPAGAKYIETEQHGMIALFDEIIRESPPLPDRDDSPPPIYRQVNGDLQWRDPTLREVLDYLKSSDPTIVADASGYLQHLTFNNDVMKEETRDAGGIQLLIDLLRKPSTNPDILRNICGCLKNLAFGSANDDSKRLIHKLGGIKALAHLLKTTPNVFVHEEATGALWNISSFDDLKEPVLQHAGDLVAVYAVVPAATNSALNLHQESTTLMKKSTANERQNGYILPTMGGGKQQQPGLSPLVVGSILFRNGTGILRNVSAANESARRHLRSLPHLIDALLDALALASERQQLDSRAIENVICLLRNLSYRVQEVVDPKFDPNRTRYQVHHQRGLTSNSSDLLPSTSSERSHSAPSGSPKSVQHKHKTHERSGRGALFLRKAKKSQAAVDSSAFMPATGPQRLWHPDTVRLYLRVLQEATNVEVLEACAAALQNLAACPFEGSILVRQTVRAENGLPILFGLLPVREDRIVGAVCAALRNLALDPKNVEFIGRFALRDLINKLPHPFEHFIAQNSPASIPPTPSEHTIGAILGIIWECVRSSAALTKAVHDLGGTDRLRALSEVATMPSISAPDGFVPPPFLLQRSKRIRKYATQVLYMMWQHKELHEMFRRNGLDESHFYCSTTGTLSSSRSASKMSTLKHSPMGESATLARPFSSQGVERPQNLLIPMSPSTPSTSGNGNLQQNGFDESSVYYGTIQSNNVPMSSTTGAAPFAIPRPIPNFATINGESHAKKHYINGLRRIDDRINGGYISPADLHVYNKNQQIYHQPETQSYKSQCQIDGGSQNLYASVAKQKRAPLESSISIPNNDFSTQSPLSHTQQQQQQQRTGRRTPIDSWC